MSSIRRALIALTVASLLTGIPWLEAAPGGRQRAEERAGDEEKTETKKSGAGAKKKSRRSRRDSASTKRLKLLAKAIRGGDEEALNEVLTQIIRAGGKSTATKILSICSQLPESRYGLYWHLLRGAASYVDKPALEELGRFIVSKRTLPIARDLLYALARNRTRHVPEAFCPVVLEGTPDLQIMAAENLGHLRYPKSVDCLIEALKAEEDRKLPEPSVVMEAVIESLTRITGKTFGANSVNWEGWWKKHRDEPLKGPSSEDSSITLTGTAVDVLDRRRREAFLELKKAPTKGVVVLTATYNNRKLKKDLNNDHMESILSRMGLEPDESFQVVPREEFLKFDLKETGALLVNCAQFHQFCICPDCKPSGGINNRLRRCSDCNRHENFSAELSGAEIRKIRNFVMQGGYLFSEDWVVSELVEKAFPRYVEAGEKLRQPAKGGEGYVRSFKVDVVPARGMSNHPYLKGIFVPLEDADYEEDWVGDEEDEETRPEDLNFDDDDDDGDGAGGDDGGDEGGSGRTVVDEPAEAEKPEAEEPEDAQLLDIEFHWQIDDESYALHVVDRSKVVPLLASRGLKEIAGKDSLVALAFRPGSPLPVGQRSSRRVPGVVVQVLSHFGKQGSRADEHTLENLLLNFLIDANSARENWRVGPAKKRKKRRR